MEITRQLVGVGSLNQVDPIDQSLKLGCQAWQQVPSPAELSLRSLDFRVWDFPGLCHTDPCCFLPFF